MTLFCSCPSTDWAFTRISDNTNTHSLNEELEKITASEVILMKTPGISPAFLAFCQPWAPTNPGTVIYLTWMQSVAWPSLRLGRYACPRFQELRRKGSVCKSLRGASEGPWSWESLAKSPFRQELGLCGLPDHRLQGSWLPQGGMVGAQYGSPWWIPREGARTIAKIFVDSHVCFLPWNMPGKCNPVYSLVPALHQEKFAWRIFESDVVCITCFDLCRMSHDLNDTAVQMWINNLILLHVTKGGLQGLSVGLGAGVFFFSLLYILWIFNNFLDF